MEPYWLNSNGFAIHADKDIPLLASLNASADGQLCLAARYQSPYKKSDQKLHLRYSICSAANVKSVHLLAASKFWKKPSSTADERMFTNPIWSTWARYKTQIDQNLTLQFASEIRRYGFNDRFS
jgi:myogenesis-regulating glycosidase